MKHVILGAGNLGRDLFMEAKTIPGYEPSIFSLSKGFDVTDLKTVYQTLDYAQPDVVWYCVGGGVSLDKYNKEMSEKASQLNLNIPSLLADKLPKHVSLVIFSSDYAADETRPRSNYATAMHPRSEFAEQKITLERILMRMQRPACSIIRVGSLYGLHKPLTTFPGKILMRYGFNTKTLKLPSNIVTPTPTRWLAGVLMRNYEELCSPVGTTIEHIAPSGGVTVKDWAKFILRGLRDDAAFDWGRDFFDTTKPLISDLGCTLGGERPIHWFELWNNYFNPEWFVSPEWKEGIPMELKHKKKTRLY